MIKTKILSELEQINNEIEELQKLIDPISPECALGDLGRFELMNDQLVSEKSLKEAINKRERLQYALRKIDTPEYGICLECDEEISIERLLVIPESTRCIACASSLK